MYSNDLNIFMKGENNYMTMKEMLIELDSTSIQIQGALDILDSYFEQIALNQFERRTKITTLDSSLNSQIILME